MSPEMCHQCRRPMKTRDGDIEPTCAECGYRPDSCTCSPLMTGDVSDLLPGATCPENYKMDTGGVFAVRTAKTGEPVSIRAAWAPIIPVCVYVDPAGDQLVELAWWDANRWVRKIVPRSVAKSGRKLVAELGDAGLPVTDADSKLAERWLAAFEQHNRMHIPKEKIARQLGWQRDGEFVIADGKPYKVEPKYDHQRGPLESHHAKGTLRGWQQAIAPVVAYPAVLPSLFSGFAASLLNPLGLDSFTVDTSGRSTRGKTISVMCGASCWHDPGEKSDGMFHWRTTMIEAEKRLNLVNGLPVVFDETRVVKTPELIDQVLYQVPKNHGTPRGGGWPSMLPWRVIILSTGEQPALSFTPHEGASARVLSVRRAPFGSDGEASAAAAGRVRDGITTNYGTAGPEFVKRLRAELARGDQDGRAALAERHRQLAEKFRGGSDIAARRAPLIACVYLAGQLAHEWGILPFGAPDADEWLSLFSEGDQERNDDRPQMALDIVAEFIAAHQDKMFGAGTGEHPPVTGWIGRQTRDGDIALLPEKVREELRRRGYELEAVLSGWLEKGVLVTRDNQRPNYLISQRLGGQTAKHLVFRRDKLVSEGDDTE